MKFEIKRYGIEVRPEGIIDEAFIEDTLGLKKDKDSIALKRVNCHGSGSLGFLEAAPPKGPFPRSFTLVYVCHPYSSDPEGNRKKVAAICQTITESRKDVIPLAPQLFMRDIMPDEMNRQEHVMAMCCDLIRSCDEVWWYGGESPGCLKEVAFAGDIGKTVVKRWEGA